MCCDTKSASASTTKAKTPKLLSSDVGRPKESRRTRQPATIQTLSVVWFALCTSLVTKHNDLVAVFYSFSGSFVGVVAISLFLGRDLKASTVGAFFGDLTTSQRRDNGLTKAYIGIIACAISLAIIGFGSSVSGRYSYLMTNLPEFHALANVAGFLAFDLWYDRVCCRLFPPHFLFTLEDAFTLSAFSAILTKWDEWDMASTSTTTHISLWLGYKMFRFTFELIGHSNTKELPDVITTISKEYLWTIHGKDYDLSSFIHRHPGGMEAILLGRGRDCTAMFESYHPFTNRHR